MLLAAVCAVRHYLDALDGLMKLAERAWRLNIPLDRCQNDALMLLLGPFYFTGETIDGAECFRPALTGSRTGGM